MSAGKGDTPRAVNVEVFRRNYDSIFAENLEQARLLAMSADREEKLRAQLQDAEIRALYEQRLKNTYKKLLKQ